MNGFGWVFHRYFSDQNMSGLRWHVVPAFRPCWTSSQLYEWLNNSPLSSNNCPWKVSHWMCQMVADKTKTWMLCSLLSGTKQTSFPWLVSEPSEPGAADHTGLLLLAQYWLISPLTLGLWGPVTPAIVWPRPILTRAPELNKALSLTPAMLPPWPQPAAPAACLGWNEVGQTNTTHRSSTLTPMTTTSPLPLPSKKKGQGVTNCLEANGGTVSINLLLCKHRCVRYIGELQWANTNCIVRRCGKQ